MNFEFKKEKLSTGKCAAKTKAEQNIETEITLPDYCAEIKRILKCTLTPGIHSVSRTGDRVSARGTVLIRVIYAGEKDKTDCYEKNLDLSVSAQLKDITDDMTIRAKAAVSYVNCRAISQRKISIGGAVNVEFCAFAEKKREILCDIVSECIETKKEKTKAEHLLCMGEKTFDMGETVVLDKNKPSIGKILRQNAYTVLESKKAVAGKLLIKGELVTEIVYCPQDSENKFERFTHSMPISQIIDVEGIDDSMDCNVRCEPSQLVVSVKSGSDAGRLVEIASRVSAFVRGTKVKEYEFIKDCYCTDGEIEAEYSLTDILCPVNIIEKTETVKESLDLGSGVKEICDIWITDTKTQMKGEGNKAKGTCDVTACVLYLDEKGNPAYNEKQLQFLSDIDLKENYESLKCDFDATVIKAEFSSLQGGKTELTLETVLNIGIYSVNSCRMLMNLKESESKNKSECKPALTLYYCEKGEKIWDIAKKYSTTVSAVMEENGIDGDSVKENRMLLIPCV